MVFYDPREAIKVYNHLRARPARFREEAEEAILHCRPISKAEVKEVSSILGRKWALKLTKRPFMAILMRKRCSRTPNLKLWWKCCKADL